MLSIAEDLWNAYGEWLPDTPARVTKTVLASLEKNGYSINGA